MLLLSEHQKYPTYSVKHMAARQKNLESEKEKSWLAVWNNCMMLNSHDVLKEWLQNYINKNIYNYKLKN